MANSSMLGCLRSTGENFLGNAVSPEPLSAPWQPHVSRFIRALCRNSEPSTRRWQRQVVAAAQSKQQWVESRFSGGLDLFGISREAIGNNEGALGFRIGRGLLVCSAARGSGLQDAPPAVTPQTLWQGLKPTVSYLSDYELDRVEEGLKVAFDAHDGQRRKSGEPYIIHPVAVAEILGQMQMDCETIIAGLLHDTVEDTDAVTFESIERQFGAGVRRIVEGETKVSKLGKIQRPKEGAPPQDVKAEDLRSLFCTMTQEVRIIIVKLADRLHNMRTLSHMPPHKQHYIADETLRVFAPLARLLGMYRIKSELEELSFMYSAPQQHALIRRRMDELRRQQEPAVAKAKRDLEDRLSKDACLCLTHSFRVETLCKEAYSIYKKVKASGCEIEDVCNIAQLRIILEPKPIAQLSLAPPGATFTDQQLCYHVLGLIHKMWTPVPGAVKDYIATAKPNGYRSLHTTLLPLGAKPLIPLEVQIRTADMDRVAEWGDHCRAGGGGLVYTEASTSESSEDGNCNGNSLYGPTLRLARSRGPGLANEEIKRRMKWLDSIREWQEEFVGNMTAREFVDTITGDLFSSRVFVFSTSGEPLNLPKGATVIDYAYQKDTQMANRMVGAKVNGNSVPVKTVLCNADVVEILEYEGDKRKAFRRHQQWLKDARTRSARHKLTKYLRETGVTLGEELTGDLVKEFVLEDGAGSWSELVESSSSGEDSDGVSDGVKRRGAGVNGHGVESFDTQIDEEEKRLLAQRIEEEERRVNERLASNGAASPSSNGRVKVNGFARPGGSPKGENEAENEAGVVFRGHQHRQLTQWHEEGEASVMWLDVRCMDRKGLLADVSQILSASGFSIKSYTGHTVRGYGMMLFGIELEVSQQTNVDKMATVLQEVLRVQNVTGWYIGCTLRQASLMSKSK
ncbi:guanosine polyphosphate pyrophosphohydrolase [Klebsormidium nitens]|uniref:GTP diphosphokinase n=1 Tax=Klebsormidium nitens TaxID=105231 RepID=A0A1Y1IFH9_KLENI|nr:guanosine polyphosphate pyrophosphohydrolase [Klebsormidium nitens]|eukprot:GAQ87841.1 guanosine polyphosphate pyrophosphohydrolase [Klebsormidium nitens]